MKRVTHERKSAKGHPWAEPVTRALLAGALSAASAGCNIVQGYQDAGDSLFPEQSTHLASPGLRLVSGHYRELGLIAGTELYLVARAADDEDDTAKLFVMPYVDPRPCEIADVRRLSVTREPSRSVPLLSYLSEDARRGTLRFADATCKTYPLSFDDARLPIAETKQSVVVWAGTELWLATPEAGERRRLAEGVAEVHRSVLGKRFAVEASGRLTLFDAAWTEQGTFGDDVSSVLRAGRSLFYTDTAGVHHIVERSGSGRLESELLVSDACSLATQDETWIALRSPCSGGKVMVIHERTGQTFTLPFDAEPSQLQLVPALGSRGRDPLNDPFWFFYLRSGEAESSQNELFVRAPAGDEHRLGARSTLRHLRLVESEGEAHGYALVDIAGDAGRYVWWNAAGETRVLAESALWQPDRLIVDSDGTVGDLAVASGDRLLVLAKGVPWQAFEYQDQTKQWTVLFHDMAEGIGRLSVLRDGLDGLQAVPPDEPFTAPELSSVASNVVFTGTSALNELLSGVIYLKNVDVTSRTARLEYRNLELRFTATVNEGVSDYLATDDEIIYSIPYGDDAGIWLVPGK